MQGWSWTGRLDAFRLPKNKASKDVDNHGRCKDTPLCTPECLTSCTEQSGLLKLRDRRNNLPDGSYPHRIRLSSHKELVVSDLRVCWKTREGWVTMKLFKSEPWNYLTYNHLQSRRKVSDRGSLFAGSARCCTIKNSNYPEIKWLSKIDVPGAACLVTKYR